MISSSASGPGRDALERQARERLVDDVQLGEEVVAIRLDVDQAGGELAAARASRAAASARRSCRSGRSSSSSFFRYSFDPSCIVTSCVGARLVVDGDVLEERHEADLLERIVVVLRRTRSSWSSLRGR